MILEMIAIPGGSFLMGLNNYNNAKPIHKVNIKPFYLGKYTITQEQYQAVMGINPSHFKGAKHPVENVSCDDAVEFCKKLLQKTGKKYRLPSEAEWEWACRAGTQTKYCFGDDKSRLEEYAWYINNSTGKTHPVGQKKSNQFGLYDIHGNVWEWCSDRWHGNYQNAPTDGSSWDSGIDNNRVRRGGSWDSDAINCRSAFRGWVMAGHSNINFGFRVALVFV